MRALRASGVGAALCRRPGRRRKRAGSPSKAFVVHGTRGMRVRCSKSSTPFGTWGMCVRCSKSSQSMGRGECVSGAPRRKQRPTGPGATFARAYSVSTCLCNVLLPPRSYAPPVSAATPLAPDTHSPRPRDGSAGSWQDNRIASIAAHLQRGDARTFATNQHRRVEAAVSVRRGRLAVPAVAGGAYERGIGTINRSPRRNRCKRPRS